MNSPDPRLRCAFPWDYATVPLGIPARRTRAGTPAHVSVSGRSLQEHRAHADLGRAAEAPSRTEAFMPR